uniref:Uncharacterized protein n=1 Tax=Anguilla anguilla TaxID=7936 RepID=A0A0E9V6H2_ANGAN
MDETFQEGTVLVCRSSRQQKKVHILSCQDRMLINGFGVGPIYQFKKHKKKIGSPWWSRGLLCGLLGRAGL